MPKFFTSFGKNGGKERLRNLLYQALCNRNKGIQKYSNEIKNYCAMNRGKLDQEEQEAQQILRNMKSKTDQEIEREIDNF